MNEDKNDIAHDISKKIEYLQDKESKSFHESYKKVHESFQDEMKEKLKEMKGQSWKYEIKEQNKKMFEYLGISETISKLSEDELWKLAFFISIITYSYDIERGWIPVSETIDVPEKEVLACDRRGEEMFGYLFVKDEQWICESDTEIMYEVVAWMNKPEPYKEKSDG